MPTPATCSWSSPAGASTPRRCGAAARAGRGRCGPPAGSSPVTPRGCSERPHVRLFVTGLGGYLGPALAAVAGVELSGTVRSRPAPAGLRSFAVDVRDERAVADAIAAVDP